MKHPFARRSVGAVLALMLLLSALPLSVLAAPAGNAEFTLIELKGTDVTLDETVFEYTGQAITPNVTVRVEDRLLTLDQDYTLEFENNVEVGTGKVIVTGIATAAPSYGYTGTVEVPFYINEKAPEFTLIELKGTDVTINGTAFAYTGSPIEPAVTVTVGGKTLTPGQDYAIEYVNNLLPGTATVIVRGIATASETVGYTGEVRIDFTITPQEVQPPVELTALNVTLEGSEFPYTGQEIRPGVSVTVEGQALENGTHYTVSYENNIQPGTGSVIVTALEGSGYAGSVRMDFTITPPAQQEYPLVEIKAENVAMEGREFPYTGNPITPKVTVTVGGKVLVQGKDYSLTYSNNVSVGTATVTVAGIATATESGGYTGTVELKFTILSQPQNPTSPVELKPENVTLSAEKFLHTGKEIKPAVTVTAEGKTLTLGQDYTVAYENNVAVGTGKVIVTGIATEAGGYTGTVEVRFSIVPDYKITQGSGCVFTKGSSATLTFTASGDVKDFDYLSINGKTVDSKYYTVKDGSTVLTLKNSFLNILNTGKYTITFHFTDGEASGTFTVAQAASSGADDSNPKTGDEFPLHALYAVMFVSLTGIIGGFFAWKKKLFK